MRVSRELFINSPAERVFAFLSDPERAPLFVPNLAGITEIDPREAGVGQKWHYEFSMMGVTLNGTSECSVFQPGAEYGFHTGGMIPSDWLYSLVPENDGTRVKVEIEYHPPQSVLSKVGSDSLLMRLNENDAERGIQNLKIILED